MLIGAMLQQPILFIIWLLAILIALSVHECAHALAAFYMGDSTAKDQGRLTLNPFAHIDWMGLILLVLVGFGWGKPVPINPYNFRKQKFGEIITSLAGPLSNFLLILIFGFSLKFIIPFLPSGNLLITFFVYLVQINAILMIFNLIPIPPLDGSKVLFALLPPKYEHIRFSLETRGSTILILVLIVDSMLNLGIFAFIFNNLIGIIYKLF